MGLTFNLGRDSAAVTSDASLNVGIGGSPSGSYKLEVTGEGRFYQSATSSTAYLRVENNRTRNAAVYTATTNGGFYAGTSIGTDTFNYQIYDGVAGSARLTIASTGAATFSSSVTASNFYTSSAVGYSAEFYRNNNADSRINITNTTTTSGGDKGLMLGEIGVDAYFYNYANGSAIFATNATERMKITSSGNVGIGTGSPSTIISGARVLQIDGSSYGFVLASSGTVIAQVVGDSASSIVNIGARSNHPLVFSQNDTERMRITSAGNLGINTTTPDTNSKLDVNGQAFVARLAVYNDNGTPSLGTSPLLYSPASATLAISTGTVERLRITSGGAIGIAGNNTPNASFHIGSALGGFNRLTQMSPTGTSADALNLIASKGSGGGDQWWSWGVAADDSYRIVKGTDLGQTGVKVTSGATSWTSTSDIRFKNVTGNIANALDKLNTLSSITYKLKNDESEIDRVGLIAQEVYEVLPEAVDKPSNEEEMWGIRYTEVIPLLVASIKELSAKVSALENR